MIQGTQYKVRFTVTDFDSGLPYTPTAITIKVIRPTGVDLYTLANGGVVNMLDSNSQPIVGRYGASLSTSAEAGEYEYQITVATATGPQVVKKRSFQVEPAL